MERTDSATGSQLRRLLYLACVLSDFSAFLVIFTVSRSLADRGYGPSYLGMIGAGLSFCSGMGALAGGYLATRWDGRAVFLGGAAGVVGSGVWCSLIEPGRTWFLPGYWLLGLGLGFFYPPLIGWLNQNENAHTNRAGVSRRLIVFCVAWNLGMLSGQLVGGRLLEQGTAWGLGTALAAASLNLMVGMFAVRRVRPIQPVVIEGEEVPEKLVARANLFKRLGWIANLGGVFGGAMVIHLLPDLMVSIGIPPREHGSLLALWRGVIILTYAAMHWSSFWHYRLGVSLGSQAIGAAGMLLIAGAHSGWMLLAGLSLLGQLVGFNYFSGLYYSTAGSHQEGRALAAGIHEATLATGMALGTMAGGWLGSHLSQRGPYALGGIFIGILMVLQVGGWLRWRGRGGD